MIAGEAHCYDRAGNGGIHAPGSWPGSAPTNGGCWRAPLTADCVDATIGAAARQPGEQNSRGTPHRREWRVVRRGWPSGNFGPTSGGADRQPGEHIGGRARHDKRGLSAAGPRGISPTIGAVPKAPRNLHLARDTRAANKWRVLRHWPESEDRD